MRRRLWVVSGVGILVGSVLLAQDAQDLVLPEPPVEAQQQILDLQKEIVRLRKQAADLEYAANQCALATAQATLDAKIKAATVPPPTSPPSASP